MNFHQPFHALQLLGLILFETNYIVQTNLTIRNQLLDKRSDIRQDSDKIKTILSKQLSYLASRIKAFLSVITLINLKRRV